MCLQSKFKRLKRGHREDRAREERGIDQIFSDDEEGAGDGYADRGRGRGDYQDDLADFIEEDEFPDEEREAMRDEAEIRRPAKHGFVDPVRMQSGMDEAAQEDMMAAFGDGTEYDWALELQEQGEEEQDREDKPLELKDVFEPSQLVEKMLTDEDNIIRATDSPERHQLARKSFKPLDLTPDEMEARLQEEMTWVSNLLWPKKSRDLDPSFMEPFREIVGNVLRFLNVDDFEVPFIFHNRKDYMIHEEHIPVSPDPSRPDAPDFEIKAQRLLTGSNLWDIFELDLKFRAFAEKREALQKAVDSLKQLPEFHDEVFEDMIPAASMMEELQDVQDYLHFQYSAQLKDASILEAEANGTQKRARGSRSMWDRLRAGKAYHMVKAFGISADAFAQNALKVGKRVYTEDPTERPDDMADSLVDSAEYSTGSQVLQAAKAMYAEELAMSPRLRKHVRGIFYSQGVIDCYRTERGLKKVDEDHPYYEFKYLRGQTIGTLIHRPELFLRMLKAEDEGLIEVQVNLKSERSFRSDLCKIIESDNFSEVAEAWNALRREVVEQSLQKLSKIIVKGVKENLKSECETMLASRVREEYAARLDQAPYKPKGMVLGTEPRVLALSNGGGKKGDAICWAYVDETGRCLENGKMVDLRIGNKEKYLPDGKDVAPFVELVERRKPDVIAVSGWSVETRRLYKDLQEIVEMQDLRGAAFEDDQERETSETLEVVIVSDEVARLYMNGDRSAADFPGLPPVTRYCIALARYMQSPLKEYASLGRDVLTISFHPCQNLLPADKILKYLEMAMVDTVNLVGIDINEVTQDSATANLLQYVSGLGPRKAQQVVRVLNLNGREVVNRVELLGDPDRGIRAAVSAKIFENCASFLWIRFEDTEPDANFLDNTRIHPEDYDTAQKIAADALDLDEEDIKAETDENGPYAIARKLVNDEKQSNLDDLSLDEYAKEIYDKLHLQKKATLELIRSELTSPYEELRAGFSSLSTDEIFTMLTGETRDSLTDGMIVPVSVKRTFQDHIEVKLDCGIDGGVSEIEFPEGVASQGQNGLEPRQVWQMHQTVQAKLMFIDRKKFTAQLSLRDLKPTRKDYDHEPDEWDEQQEAQDKKDAMKEQEGKTGRVQRVIKHPLFRPFNTAQAEEFLGSQSRGDVVIRPSSKGPDHLVITWKVSDNIYQHVDVLEINKENEFSVGRLLRIKRGDRKKDFEYSDLDELIVLHIKAMAKKVDEMTGDERYQSGSKDQTRTYICLAL